MSDNRNDQSKSKGCMIAVLLLPVLYVLGAGPAVAIHRHAPPAIQAAIMTLYGPLDWVLELTRGTFFFDSLIFPYFRWWKSLAP